MRKHLQMFACVKGWCLLLLICQLCSIKLSAQINILHTIAGTGQDNPAGYSTYPSPTAIHPIDHAYGITYDCNGNIYITELECNDILKIDNAGNINRLSGHFSAGATENWPGTGSLPPGSWLGWDPTLASIFPSTDACAITGYAGDGLGNAHTDPGVNFGLPSGIVYDPVQDKLYIADTRNNRIRSIDLPGAMIGATPAPGALNTYVPNLLTTLTLDINNPVGETPAYGPTEPSTGEIMVGSGIALDDLGNLFIADNGNNRIVEQPVGGGPAIIFAGSGVAGFGGDGGLAISAKFNRPTGVAVDRDRNVYVADYNNNRIRKINAVTGIITTIAGTGVLGFSGDTGPATAAKLAHPISVAVDDGYRVYVADLRNNRIRVIDQGLTDTLLGNICTVVGNGTTCDPAVSCPFNALSLPSFSQPLGDGGNATLGSIWFPSDVKVDKWGNLFIIDQDHNKGRYVCHPESLCTPAPAPAITIDSADLTCNSLPVTLKARARFAGCSPGYQWQTNRHNVAGATYDTFAYVPVNGDVITCVLTPQANPIFGVGCPTNLSTVTSDSIIVSIRTGAIIGVASMCVGDSVTFSDTSSGGTWSSSNTAKATVDLSTGIVHGVGAGTATITYKVPAGCYSIMTVTVNPLPSAIGGTTSICQWSSIILTDAGGGTWSSSDTTISAGLTTGIITGLHLGTATVTYTLSTGCAATITVTVIPAPVAIVGPDSLCQGASIALTDGTLGGTWSSTSGHVFVNLTTGTVTGLSPGTAVITYQLSDGCAALKTVTVNPLPSAIAGLTAVCLGTSTTLSDPGGGTWSTSDTTISIGLTTGLVTGLDVGTATVTYTLPTGCWTAITVTINPLPAAIAGPDSLCVGSTITLTDATAGGTWGIDRIYSSYASVNPTTGLVTGLAAGTAIVTYKLTATGCMAFKTVTVNPLPAAIGGSTVVCVGSTTMLTDAGGGTWSSSDTTIASVDPGTGVTTGISPGTAIVTYTLPTGCQTTVMITVNLTPAPIIGPFSVCHGYHITLSDPTPGGTWFILPGFSSIATINATTGLVTTGISTGTALVTYIMPGTGCYATATITVNPVPAAISGTTTVCQGLTTGLADATGGGTWSSSDTTIASVDAATGVVTGIVPGTATISYTLPTGCFITTTVLVNPLPHLITGPDSVCIGSSITAIDSTAGGTWSTAVLMTPVISINPTTGVITTVSVGTASITYTLGTGCIATAVITVNPYPIVPPITGYDTLCTGGTTTLSNSVGGGVWGTTSSIVSISGAGVVTADTTDGSAIISYTVTSAGCSTTVFDTVIVVLPTPPIVGNGMICFSNDTLHNEVAGGVWSSSDTSIVKVDSVTGIATGISTGSATITYTATSPCGTFTVTMVIKVNPTPFISTNFVVACQTLASSDGPFGGFGTILPSTGCVDVCDSSVVRYYANGVIGTYMWAVTGGVVVHNYGDSIDVLWPHVGTIGSITLTVTAGKCSGSVKVCVQVIAKPHALFAPSEISACLNDAVSFTDLSTFDTLSPIVSWYWNFGDGSSSGVQDPTHTFTVTNPSDTVTLVVKNACNCTDTFRMIISISNTPGPRIHCPSIVCEHEHATYTTDIGCGTYNWSVIGGTIISGAGSPTIMVDWNAVGPDGYGYVSLVEPCAPCPDTTTIKIPVILQNPGIFGPATVCQGTQNEYTLPLWAATQYMWGVLGSPGAIVGAHDDHKVVIDFTLPGTYTIHGWYQNRIKLCGGNLFKTVTVLPKVTIAGPLTVCQSDTASYVLSLPLPASWTLTDYSGTVFATGSGPSVLLGFPTPGTYILTATGPFCCDPVYITVDMLPPPPDSITGATTICVGRVYTYVAHTSFTGAIFNWNIIGGTITPTSGSDSVTVHWTSTGTKKLFVNLENIKAPHCSGPAITKEAIQEVIVPHVLGSAIYCPNTVFSYSCDYTRGEVYDWKITPDTAGSVISGMHDPNIQVQWNNYTNPATITVTVRKCDIVTTASLAVHTVPPPVITLTGSPTPACAGDLITFTATAGGSNYTWYFADGSLPIYISTGSTNTITHRFPKNPNSTNAVYNVSVSAIFGSVCPTGAGATFPISIYPTPDAYLYTDIAGLCTGDIAHMTAVVSSNVTVGAYSWEFNGAPFYNPSYAYTTTTPGTYVFTMTTTDGCKAFSNPVNIYTTTCGGGWTGGCPHGIVPITITTQCNTITLGAGNASIDPSQNINWVWDYYPPLEGTFPLNTPTVTATYLWPSVYPFRVYGTYLGKCFDTTVYGEVGIVPYFTWTTDCGSGGVANIHLHDGSPVLSTWTVTSIDWSDGGSPIPSGPNPTYARVPGTYSVTESISGTMTGGAPFVCNVTFVVYVPPIPDASFTIVPTPTCENIPVLFSPLSPGGVTSFYWDFGDGATILKESPQRNYDSIGISIDRIYSVTLTVWDDYGCTDTSTGPVDIFRNRVHGNLGPINPEYICSSSRPFTLSYSPDPGTPTPVSWLWKEDTAMNVVGTASTYDVSVSGAYWVTVTDTYQCIATMPIPVKNVAIIYTPKAAIFGNNKYCFGDNVQLYTFAGKSATYQWFRDGVPISTSSDITDAGLLPGAYGYRLVIGVFDTASSITCYDSSGVDSVYVFPLPPNPIVTGPFVLDCNAYHLQLVASDPQTGVFNWSNGTFGPVDDIFTGGPYGVSFTDINGCHSSTQVYVPCSPETYFPYLPTGCYTVCMEQLPLRLFGPPDVSFTYWAWLLNGTPDLSGSGPMLPYDITGSGKYQWDLDNGLCRKQSDTLDITAVGCDNCEQVNLSAVISCTPADPASYSITVSFINPMPGTSYIIGTDIGPVTPFSGTLFTPGWSTLTLTFTTLYLVPIPPNVTVEIEFTLPDGRKCFIKDTLALPPCGWIPERHTNPADTGSTAPQNKITISNALMVFPNPASSSVNVSYDYGAFDYKDRTLTIFDEMGRKVQFNAPRDAHGNWNLNISDWVPGLYIIRMEGNGQALQTQKFVIGH